MKVIAIHNDPDIDTTISWAKIFNLERAYYKGDIFETKEVNPQSNELIIFNHHVQDLMEVNPENFQSLDEYRKNQINEILT